METSASIFVQPGFRWIAAAEAVPAPGGRFQLPPEAGVATAFLDMNGNRRLDRFSEPSVVCDRTGTWLCEITPSRTWVHRIQRTDGDEHGDIVNIGVEDYEKTGMPARDVAVCLADRSQCAQRELPRPYVGVAEAAHFLSLCLDGNFELSDWPMDVVVTRDGAERMVQVPLPQPAGLNVSKRRLDDGSLELEVRADQEIDRLLVWVGDATGQEPRNVVWTSEVEPGAARGDGGGFLVHVPASAIVGCFENCSVVVQAVSVNQLQGMILMSEGQVFLRHSL